MPEEQNAAPRRGVFGFGKQDRITFALATLGVLSVTFMLLSGRVKTALSVAATLAPALLPTVADILTKFTTVLAANSAP